MYIYETEKNIATDFFFNSLEIIDDQEDFYENIETLIRFLSSSDKAKFSINDVKHFYSLSDMIDEYDILRLMNYLEIIDYPPSTDSILAQQDTHYLVVTEG
ncbi:MULTISPECIES: hypothetical protein [Staphylococcus]|uniref:hypothetical protein n=1 Tax=Staphylococcus TaxID=1279 RepID=UPI0028FDFF4E|nr:MULTISPECIES: hypothetical protein [Staphylococcus]MDU0435919.1 hypothetical protein [Staphylococcus haemolyticus]MDU0463556.1 hypothetical protein [Staphylococcus ureilyticus]